MPPFLPDLANATGSDPFSSFITSAGFLSCQAICAAEELCVNTDALTRLADKSHLDVRSCLNTLQFVARRASAGDVRNASSALLTAISEGIKDDRKDLFEGVVLNFTTLVVNSLIYASVHVLEGDKERTCIY